MGLLTRMGLAFLCAAQLSAAGFAQSWIITTYAGPGSPVNGSLATSQAVDWPPSVMPDDAGGFYVASYRQNRVYRVAADGRISLVAGNGTGGFSGDGGQATSAQLFQPSGLAVDTAGNLFIADEGNSRIRKVTPGGVISTVAGNGSPGFSGDGGPATSAQINYPWGIAVDTAGNLFIADAYNHRVRKVTPGGVINTVAGDGTSGYSGDGGPATSAQISQPNSVAVDAAGNLFIADCGNSRVREVTPGGLISTVAGNGTEGYSGDGGQATLAKLKYPYGVAVDAAGNLFIADTLNNRVREVTPGGMISTVAGNGTDGFSGDGGQATSAQLSQPIGVTVDTAGNLFIADSRNNRVREVTPGGVISTVAGNGTGGFSGDGGQATSAQLSQPIGIALDAARNLFIADYSNFRVRKVTPGGVISTVAGNGNWGYSGDGGPATSAQLTHPRGVAVDGTGNLFIGDTENNRVRKVTPGGVISTVAGGGISGLGDGGPATSAELNYPSGVAVDTAGNLFIADAYNHRVRKVTPGGVINTVAGDGTSGYSGDGGPATSAQLNYPHGIAVDTAGNLFIADTGNNRVREVTPGGVISTVAGGGTSGLGDGGLATSAQFRSPFGVAVNTAGNLFIADTLNDRVRKVTPGGVISTVAGNGIEGYSGDGGPATSAQLFYPQGVAMDTAGNLFIADCQNDRVRKVAWLSVSTNLTLNAGGSAASSTAASSGTTQTGYATLAVNTGATPYGTAVFSFRQNGVTVTEAGVPASPPTTLARVFIDWRSSVLAVPAQSNSGTININTGIAVVNPGTAPASITYTLRNIAGTILSIGNGTIAVGAHFARFIDQLTDVAPNFNLPSNFQNTTQFGTLEIAGDQPVSVLALRGTNNQRNDFLITTTPVADLTKPLSNSPIYFSQFVDGGGYTTSLVLLNTSGTLEAGILQMLDDNGDPLSVQPVGGTAGSSFRYSIQPNGVVRLQTDGSPTAFNKGWVRLTPDTGTSTPIGSGIFAYNPVNMLLSESGIPTAISTTHARIYLDLSGSHNTGLAIANIASSNASIAISAFQMDGVTPVGTSQGSLSLSAYGHDAKFVDQFITGLPTGFTGVLDISSTTPFAALTIRSLLNERHDFLMTTFPIADANAPAPSPIVFPQVADGGGYVTQFIFISPSGPSTATLSFWDETGAPLAIGQ